MISIHITNPQRRVKIDRPLLRRAVKHILSAASITRAEIGIALVDDTTIAAVHGEFLDDPTPTDVISFVLDASNGQLEGEIVASADTAARQSVKYRWPATDELLLYVVHGMLHLVGYDDTTPSARRLMRRREREMLAALGVVKAPLSRTRERGRG